MLAPVGVEDAEIAANLCREAGVASRLMPTSGSSGVFAYERRGGLDQFRGFRPAEGDLAPQSAPNLDEYRCVLVFGHPQWDPCRNEAVCAATGGADLLFDRQGWLSRTRSPSDAVSLPAQSRTLLCNYQERVDALGHEAALRLDSGPHPGFTSSIVKDGRWGVHLLSNELTSFPALYSPTVGDIGSGDVFAGALAASLASGGELNEAIPRAVAAASVAIADPAPLPAADFALGVDQLLAAQTTLPLITPAERSRAPLCLQCADDPFVVAHVSRMQDELRRAGFTAAELRVVPSVEPLLSLAQARLKLAANGQPLALEQIVEWVAMELRGLDLP
jgi:hypothetical protein